MVETEIDGAWVVVEELLVELLFVDELGLFGFDVEPEVLGFDDELELPVLDDELEPFEFDDELELPVLDDELELPVLDDELELPVLDDASELLPTVTPSAYGQPHQKSSFLKSALFPQ